MELADGCEAWNHVLIGQHQDANRVPVFNGGVVCVQVFQEGQHVCIGDITKLHLHKVMKSLMIEIF